jgi:hypothetical protein
MTAGSNPMRSNNRVWIGLALAVLVVIAVTSPIWGG